MKKPNRSNRMPGDFSKRISAGLKLWWARRKVREVLPKKPKGKVKR